jgi:hypothetical protein
VPVSSPEGKEWTIQEWVSFDTAHTWVLDIGPGMGTYSDLLRDSDSGEVWCAVEAWAPYVDEFGLWEKYDRVSVGDVRHLATNGDYDLYDIVIAGDVLEHMSNYDAVKVIDRIQQSATVNDLFVSVPIIHAPQGAVGGNPFEEHKYHWGFQEMLDVLGPDNTTSYKGEVVAVYHWRRFCD